MSKIALLFLTYKNIAHRANKDFKKYLAETNVYIHHKPEFE